MAVPAWSITILALCGFLILGFVWIYLRYGRFKRAPRWQLSTPQQQQLQLPVGYVFDARYGVYYYDSRPRDRPVSRRKSGVCMTSPSSGRPMWAWAITTPPTTSSLANKQTSSSRKYRKFSMLSLRLLTGGSAKVQHKPVLELDAVEQPHIAAGPAADVNTDRKLNMTVSTDDAVYTVENEVQSTPQTNASDAQSELQTHASDDQSVLQTHASDDQSELQTHASDDQSELQTRASDAQSTTQTAAGYVRSVTRTHVSPTLYTMHL